MSAVQDVAPQHSCRQAAMLVDLMKFCRVHWMSRPDMASALEVKEDTIRRWVRELVAHGVLIEREGVQAEGVPGYAPQVYTLAEAWGGKLAPGVRE